MNLQQERKSTSEFSEEELANREYEEQVFGKISDSYQKDYLQAKEYAADLRFAPAGPRPPVPPVGGQAFNNDDADTIKINSSCLQNLTSKITKQNTLNEISNEHSNSSMNSEPQTESSISYSPNLSTNLRNTSTHSSPDLSNSLPPKDLYSLPRDDLGESNGLPPKLSDIFPQFDSDRKRDAKLAGKGKIECKGCHLQYHKLKQDGFCHNCFKIFEAVEGFVRANHGTFVFNEKKCAFQLTCDQGHNWKVDFKTKQVKKWCKACKKSARATRKEYFKRLEEEEFKEKMRMQQELFNQAKVDPSEVFDDPAEDDTFQDYDEHHRHHGYHHPHHRYEETEEEKQQSERFLAYLIGEEGEDRTLSQDLLDEVVNFILRQPDERLIRFFQQICQEKRVRAFRRLARMVHPDKNRHD